MSYIELFENYLTKKLSSASARAQIEEEYARLVSMKETRDEVRANLCLTFFTRYKQYNCGEISRQDLLLFLRNFILFVGRFPMPPLIEKVIRESGLQFGLSVATDGCVDASYLFPEWLPNQSFVKQVYELKETVVEKSVSSIGDSIIAKHSHFTSYRSIEQKIAVHAAVNLPEDYTLMVSLPTGGGKSLITQMVAATSNKLTIVIVPTVALASDQFIQAQNSIVGNDICDHIFCYRSDTDQTKVARMQNEISNQKARLIFTSPEAMLKNLALHDALLKAAKQKYLGNVVIDEAHIVPDWGTYFRPDFQIFSVVLRKMREWSNHTIRTYLLSATLSEDVVQVLFELFGQDGKNVQYRCDSLRKEPRFIFRECHQYTQREKQAIELVRILPKPLILYVIEPAEAEQFQKLLAQQGYKNIQIFTGKTPSKQREELLKSWKEDRIDVMIATSAFGMGVDKSNVRTILHACVPENLSRFYQEVGRAGRDGLPSLSILMPYIGKSGQRSDLEKAFGLVKKSVLRVDNLMIRWYSMVQSPDTYIEGDRITADVNTVPSSFSDEDAQHTGIQNMMWNVNALLLLRRERYIQIEDVRYVPDKNTYLFTFKLMDTATLMDKEKLRRAIQPDREKEYEMRTNGYRQMADLVRNPKKKCWGRRLTTLFPLAEEVCSGCPVHSSQPINYDDSIKIRENFPIKWTDEPMNGPLRKLFGSLYDVVVPVEDWESVDLNELISRSNALSLDCIVLPKVDSLIVVPEGMILSSDEFLIISKRAPWLFKRGILILFDENQSRNNQLFEACHTKEFSRIHKILLGKEDMMIYSQMRPLNEFLDCNYGSLAQFQKE